MLPDRELKCSLLLVLVVTEVSFLKSTAGLVGLNELEGFMLGAVT